MIYWKFCSCDLQKERRCILVYRLINMDHLKVLWNKNFKTVEKHIWDIMSWGRTWEKFLDTCWIVQKFSVHWHLKEQVAFTTQNQALCMPIRMWLCYLFRNIFNLIVVITNFTVSSFGWVIMAMESFGRKRWWCEVLLIVILIICDHQTKCIANERRNLHVWNVVNIIIKLRWHTQ